MPMGSNGTSPIDASLTGRGYEQIDLADGLVHTLTLPAGIPQPFVIALEAQGGAFRYRDDGTAPTNTVGFLCADGGVITVQLANASNIKLIRDGADTGKVNVNYHTYSTANEA